MKIKPTGRKFRSRCNGADRRAFISAFAKQMESSSLQAHTILHASFL
jgi:hypothetical protein